MKNTLSVLFAVFCGAGFVQLSAELAGLEPPGYFAFYVTAGAAALLYLVATLLVFRQGWRIYSYHDRFPRFLIVAFLSLVWPIVYIRERYLDYRLLNP